MIDLNELSQLVAFADLGTLSRVAEEFHISTPSITRSMQHLEEAFGVPLFLRLLAYRSSFVGRTKSN